MANQKWRFLDMALERLSQGRRPRGMDTLLIERLEAAISSSDVGRLENTRDRVVAFADRARDHLPEHVLEQLMSPDDLGEAALAYEIGMVDFAAHFAARAAQQRVPDAFMNALTDKKYEPLMQRLFLQETSNVDLARAIDKAEETVSRALAELRSLGLVDCRREGRRVMNFLTPAARAALPSLNDRPTSRDADRAAVRRSIEERTQELEPHLRSKVVFEDYDEALAHA